MSNTHLRRFFIFVNVFLVCLVSVSAKAVETDIIKTVKGNIVQETYRNNDGSISEVKRTLEGKLEGLQETYTYKGQLKETIEYSNGIKHGLHTGYHYDDGLLFYADTYVDGVKKGPFKFTPEGYKGKYYALDEGFYDENEKKTGQLKRYLALKKDVIASKGGHYDRWLLTSGEYERGNRSGTWTDFDEEGRITKETTYTDDSNSLYKNKEYFEKNTTLKSHEEHDEKTKQGFKKVYFANGQLNAEGLYKNNVLDGLFKRYDESGQLREIGERKDGDKVGQWKVYNTLGLIVEDSIYTDVSCCLAFKETKYEYTSEGKLKSIRTNDNLTKTNNVSQYHDVLYQSYNPNSGALNEVKTRKVITYPNGQDNLVKHGLYQMYTTEGELKTEGNYSKNKKSGVWKYFKVDGKLKNQITYLEGEEIGTFQKYEYFDNGVKSKSKIGVRAEDKTLETRTYFYENGKIKQSGDYLIINEKGSWKRGKDGEWATYYESGERQSLGSYLDGVKQGVWTYYYENRNIESVGAYLPLNAETNKLIKKLDEEAKDGLWKYFDEDGQLIEKTTFQVSNDYKYLKKDQNIYHENGKLKTQKMFHNELEIGIHKEYLESGELLLNVIHGNGIDQECIVERFYLSGVLKSWSKSRCLSTNRIRAQVTKFYFENKQLQFEVTFDDYGGVFNVVQYFNIEGQPLEIGSLKDGYGTFNQYDDDNEIVEIETYDDGELINVGKYVDGELVE